MGTTKNLDHWKADGEHLLVVQPFMDSLIVRGEGCYLIDAEGNRILDLAAGQFCSILGHNHEVFRSRLKAQIDDGIHLGDQYVSPAILRAASRLAEISPGTLNKVIFLSTGSEANEFAIRIAKVATGRTGMLAFTRGYYGTSLATRTLSSISDQPGSTDFQPAPVHQFKLMTPSSKRCPIGRHHPECDLACMNVSFEILGDHAENIAAVIVEPIVSAGGMIFPPKDYIRTLYQKAKQIGALFIVDEAQTGFGRTGRWFDIEHTGVVPDVLVVSKTAGNGYPAAAVIVTDQIADSLEASGFSHLSSHQNDPLAAAAVHAVIDIVESEKLIQHSAEVGRYFLDRLQSLQNKYAFISDVRGRGLMIGLELTSSTPGHSENLALQVAMLCEQRGMHITYSYYEPVIRFIPPLILSTDEVDSAITILDEVLSILEKGNKEFPLPGNPRSGPYLKRMMGQSFSPLTLARKMWRTSPQQWTAKLRKLS